MAGERFIYGSNPGIPINYFQQMADPANQQRDWLTRAAKGELKNIYAGKDVSSIGALNTISQNAAVQRQQAQEGGGTGSAVLESAQGGDQEALQRAITNKAVTGIDVGEGMAKQQAVMNLTAQDEGELRQGQQMEQQQNEWANNLYLQALGMKYPSAYQPYYAGVGAFAAKAAIGAATGAGAGVAKDYGYG